MATIIPKKFMTGENEVEAIFENASLLGVELIEVYWNRLSPSVHKVIGYKVPIVSHQNPNYFEAQVNINSEWVDGTLKFFPDKNLRCWGYIYDTEENRHLVRTSLSTGWYTVADKKVRKELEDEAREAGFEVDVAEKPLMNVKKTVRERNAEQHANEIEKKYKEMIVKTKLLEEELKRATGEKAEYVNKRINQTEEKPLKGVRIKKDKQELQEVGSN